MNKHTPRKELELVLDQLDDDDAKALATLIDESPELLHQILDEYGYVNETSSEDDCFISNESPRLTNAQADLSLYLSGRLDSPKTLDEIVELIGADNSEFGQKYQSAQYRSWVGDQLAALVDTGEFGRFKRGRTVHYTKSPKTAVQHWARINERFIHDVSIADVKTIADSTGMPSQVVRSAIHELNND